jgi:Flp pilus assembly protein TadD
MTVPLTQSSILIIDDFAGMPTLLREFVKAMGVNTIDTASNGKACGLLRDVVKNNHENVEISSQIQAVFESEQLGAEGLALVNESRQEVININNHGVMLAKNGELQEAAKLLRQAVENLPNNEVIIMNLCGLLISLMNKEGKSDLMLREVKDLLARVSELNPANKKHPEYSAALARIESSK